jgi:hypothetical protein
VRTALAAWLPLLAVVGATIAISLGGDVTPRMLMQDATTVLEAPFYVGSVSLLGLLLWAAATAVSLLGGLALARDPGWRQFLVASGALSALLTFDDAFLLHDEILPIHLGVSGDLFGVVYLVAMLGLILRFRALLATSNWILLAVALVLFGTSAVVDVLSSRLSESVPSALIVLGEDGTKLVGIGTWLAYLVSATRQAATSLTGATPLSTGSGPGSPPR